MLQVRFLPPAAKFIKKLKDKKLKASVLQFLISLQIQHYIFHLHKLDQIISFLYFAGYSIPSTQTPH